MKKRLSLEEMSSILEELDDELSVKKGFFSRKIDTDRCCELVAALKANLPAEMRKAQQIVLAEKQILENADIAAQNTINEAAQRANHIVDNSELVKKAEDEKRKIIEAAKRQCEQLATRTKEHLDETFKELEQFLLSTLAMVRNNREELRSASLLPKNL